MTLPGSGAKAIVYNTRERLVSTDPNRAQQFTAQGIAEVLRYLLDQQTEQDLAGGGVENLGAGTETPLRATVLGGLRVQPDLGPGSLNCFVTPGMALLIDNPSPGIDDSVASYVVDPGVQLAGALTLTPGAGSTRIDVVECQRVTNVLESDNRDVFNVSTGLFSPTQVTKVQAGQLVYRIRLGTPGSGFPGVVAGWLPLMVASVPSGATTWDVVTCWDVRPLASDRANGVALTTRKWEENKRVFIDSDVTSDAAKVQMQGEVDATFRGYKAGGVLQKDSSLLVLDITDTAVQAASFPGFGNTGALWYLYLVYPFGLPRWVRYASAPSSRVPRGMRGIPAVSLAPCNFGGNPRTSSVATPAVFGLQDSASVNAICVASGRARASGSTVPLGVMADGRIQYIANLDSNPVNPTSNTTTAASWTFTDDTHMPGNARALWVRLFGNFQFPFPAAGAEGIGYDFGLVTVSNSAGNTSYLVPVGVDGGSHTFVDSDPGGGGTTPGVLFKRSMTVRIPLTPTFLNSPGARQYIVTWSHLTSITATSCFAAVRGWELGP